MAIDRPTFSENWYRVASLRPRLRGLVQVHRQHYRGQLWYVLRDPSNNQFFRVTEPAYYFLGLLDGRRTVADAWAACNEALGDAAPTQGEAIQLFGQLYASNLLHADLPADAEAMFERYRKRMRREVGGYMMNLLFARIPLFDPDRLLDRLVGTLGWLFSPVGFALWCVVLLVGAWQVAGQAGELLGGANDVLAPRNLPWLYLAFAIIKALHELGHGLACKRFGQRERGGGEVHTIGIMLLVLMPVPYVDASSAWAFRSRWHRAIVGAAGMYVELAAAAVAAVIWAHTAEGTAIHSIAYNAMFIASVSTILFNANPLIRFDGYYILSDLLEIPNLNQRSREFVYYLVKKFIFAVRNPRDPSHSRVERFWLLVYAVTSFIYRVVLMVGIILFVSDKLFFIGALLAMGAMIAWGCVPLGKFLHYLANHAELSRTRGRAVVASAAFVATLIGAVTLVPVPDRGRAEGVVEADQSAWVHMPITGFLVHAAPTGATVDADAALVRARNVELEVERQRLAAQRRLAEARYRKARTEEPAAAQVLAEQIAVLEEQIARVERELAQLAVHPPFAGTWVAPELDQVRGGYLERGATLGQVLTVESLTVRVTADQYLGPRIEPELGPGARVEMRVPGWPEHEYAGVIERILPAGQRDLPSPALGQAAGGALAVDPQDEQGRTSPEPFFEVRVKPETRPAEAPPLWPGQRVVVRFEMSPKPIGVQLWRALRQVVQQRFQI